MSMEDLRRAVIRIDATEIESLRAEVARLTGELASCQGLLDTSKAELEERTAERDAALSGVTALQRHLDGLQKLVLAHENAEASVCPEDVGIVEYAKALRKERDAALTLAEPLDRLYEWAKRTIRADIQSPMEIMGEYESLREERDGMLAQIRALNRAATEIQGERDGMAAALNSLQSAARAVAHYHRTGYGPEVHRRFHDLIDHLDAMAAQTEAATVKEFSKVQPEGGEHA